MPATAVRTKNSRTGGYDHLFFTTVEDESGIRLELFVTDDTFNPSGLKAHVMHFISTKTEEKYHTDLRIDAIRNKEFVKEYSTNPEWNPKEEEGTNHGDRTDRDT